MEFASQEGGSLGEVVSNDYEIEEFADGTCYLSQDETRIELRTESVCRNEEFKGSSWSLLHEKVGH